MLKEREELKLAEGEGEGEGVSYLLSDNAALDRISYSP